LNRIVHFNLLGACIDTVVRPLAVEIGKMDAVLGLAATCRVDVGWMSEDPSKDEHAGFSSKGNGDGVAGTAGRGSGVGGEIGTGNEA
jgi:hypothetical protein